MIRSKLPRAHHLISSTPLPRVSKPLMSPLAQQQTRYKASSMVFRQPSSRQGKFSSSSEAIPNQVPRNEDLLPRLGMAHVSNSNQDGLNIQSNQGGLNIQSLATGLNNSNHQQLTSSQPQPSSASAQQLNPTELETLAQAVYRRLRQRLEVDRERHGFHSGRLPW